MTAFSTSRVALLAVSLAALLTISGCATRSAAGNVYTSGQAQREQIVRMGVVESVRAVTIQRQSNNVGPLAGGAIGGIAGSTIGGGRGSMVASVLGAVAGGVAGQAIESNQNQRPGVEITVRLDSGELRAIVQETEPQQTFRPGERVRILSGGGTSRVTH